jgi:putative DNA-invertase from lambdoid prophage Rac
VARDAESAEVKTAALYVRVSRKDQNERNQLPDLRKLARARGLRIVAIYSERVRASKERPRFEAMRQAAHRGEFQVLLVWALDRLGRSLIHNVRTVLELEQDGIEIVSHREDWMRDTGPVRNLLISIFSWVAEQESRRISERTLAGLERARREGTKLGRRRNFFDIKRALELRADGLTIRAIAKRIKVPKATLQRGLADPKRLMLRTTVPTGKKAVGA